MTSQLPPAAAPGPDGVPPEERPDERQPDPFGDPTDASGGEPDADHPDSGADEERPKNDPRGQ